MPPKEAREAVFPAHAGMNRVVHQWRAPQVVRDYLESADESLQEAARAAIVAAARDESAWAATHAARAAANISNAAWKAARAAAWAAESAAWKTARGAAWETGWEAARKDFNARVEALFGEEKQ